MAKRALSWNKYGPLVYRALKLIYDTPLTDRTMIFNHIIDAGELLEEIESKLGGEE